MAEIQNYDYIAIWYPFKISILSHLTGLKNKQHIISKPDQKKPELFAAMKPQTRLVCIPNQNIKQTIKRKKVGTNRKKKCNVNRIIKKNKSNKKQSKLKISTTINKLIKIKIFSRIRMKRMNGESGINQTISVIDLKKKYKSRSRPL